MHVSGYQKLIVSKKIFRVINKVHDSLLFIPLFSKKSY